MAQPAKSANPNAAQASDTARPRSVGILAIVVGLVAVVLGASAIVYYQSEAGTDESSATTVSSPLKSDNATSAPAKMEQPSPDSATPSAASVPSDLAGSPSEPDATSATASGDANVVSKPVPRVQAKPARRQVAKASKPARPAALEPRDRHIVLGAIPHPAYPVQALRAHEQGTVLVLAQVDINGQVIDTRVIGHSGSTVLDRAAPEEVRHWKFLPAMHDGRPVVASVKVPVDYRLNQ